MKSLGPIVFQRVRYDSLHAAAVAHGLRPSMVINRVNRHGWTVARALTAPPTSPAKPVKIGKVSYDSQAEALAAYGLDEATVRYRVKTGIDPTSAFLLGRRSRGPVGRPVECDGVTYPSAGALARAHGLDPKIVSDRIRDGWSPSRAVAVPPKARATSAR